MLIANQRPDKLVPARLISGSACPTRLLQTFQASCRNLQTSLCWGVERMGIFVVAVCVALAGPASPARAGLSASDVVVAVNAKSLNSRTLANHYVQLRHIPAINVVVLEDVPSSEVIGVDDFRDKILKPLLQELDRRKLLGHIQCIAYSADFPTAIDISADLQQLKDRHQLFTPVGSINALTYLYADVLAKNPSYISLHSNLYARREMENYFTNPGGAATEVAWNKIQELISGGQHAQAVDALEALLSEQPHQHPVAYLAASQAALAGDSERAIKLLKQAVAAGWNGSRYLRNDQRFASLRDEAEFQVIELLLDDSIREMQPPQAFDARISWTPNGLSTDKPQLGKRYLLSTVLGVTRGAGTSLPEAIAALRRSASADYSHPAGKFYFSLTDDVRTTTRQWGFISAVDDLKQLGFDAEIISTPLPQGKRDILGVQLGTPNYNWSSCGSELLPGALADNLTSLGGVMTGGGGQTTLSEMIRAGAAGSSGTVTEPYALQEKFPHSQMYVAYARGASLAEAFYSYVTGPYQLLIVGDPLCQPCSHAPRPEVDAGLRQLAVDEPLRLKLPASGISYSDWLDSPEPVATRTDPLQATAMCVLLDGTRPSTIPAKADVNIASKGIPAGYHEIVLQFIAEGPLSPRSNATIPLWIGPANSLTLEIAGASASPEPKSAAIATATEKLAPASTLPKPVQQISLQAGTVTAQVTANFTAGPAAGDGNAIPAVKRVSLWHGAEQLEVATGDSGQFSVSLDRLGMGPVRLYAHAELSDSQVIKSLPIWLEVSP